MRATSILVIHVTINTDLTPRQLTAVFRFELSGQQWNAVSSNLSPSVMIAGAGSGKTTSMSARIAWLVGSGYVRPENILGLTFTTKATAQLLEAARSTIKNLAQTFPDLVPEESSDPVISTYNSFAAGIVQEFGALLGRDFTGSVLSDGARYQYAYRLVCSTDIDMSAVHVGPASVTSSMLSLDGELSELALDPIDIRTHDQKLLYYLSSFSKHNDSTRRMIAATGSRIALSRLVEQWREFKAERDLVEFSDQVRLARVLVQTFPSVASTIRSRYLVALLDEYQDTSISQRILLQAVFGSGFPLTAVGDPCQAIYGWRGASVANINDFTEHFPLPTLTPSPVFKLTKNRRSGVKILEAANIVSEALRVEHPQVGTLVPGRDHPGYLTLALFHTAEKEVEWMAQRIADQHAGLGDSQDIAVLSPTTPILIRMRDLLRHKGVPVQLHSSADLLAEPIVIDLQSLLTVIHEPTANPEFLRWATGVRFRIGARDIAALGQRAAELSATASRRRAKNVDEALADAVDGIDSVDINSVSDALFDLGDPGRYSAEAFKRFTHMAKIVRELRLLSGLPLVEFIGAASRLSGVDIQSQIDTGSDREHIAVSAFIDLAADFTDADGRVSLGAFLERLADIKRFDLDVDFEQPTDPRAVQLFTVYKAKGLEFTHVYLPNMTKDGFPGGRRPRNWTTDASMVPWPTRHDAPAQLANFPDYDTLNWPARVHKDEYLGHFAAYRELESDRLAYVAITRAKDSLTITSSWWGFGHKTPRGPHRYLQQLHDHFAGLDIEIPEWVLEPGEECPAELETSGDKDWPEVVPDHIVDSLREQATFLRSYSGSRSTERGLSATESVQVAQWQHSLDQLRQENALTQTEVRRVPLPGSVGASTLMRAMREPEELAKDLARPMPRRSSIVANKGTIVHSLIEEHYAPRALFDPSDLFGLNDVESQTEVSATTDSDIDKLRNTFLAMRFAEMTPVAVEQPFSIALGGIPVTGYIDAIFLIDGRYMIVDWKTGTSTHLDPMQLAIYRLAWSRIANVDWQQVDTCFVMLAEGSEISPDTDALVKQLLDRN